MLALPGDIPLLLDKTNVLLALSNICQYIFESKDENFYLLCWLVPYDRMTCVRPNEE